VSDLSDLVMTAVSGQTSIQESQGVTRARLYLLGCQVLWVYVWLCSGLCRASVGLVWPMCTRGVYTGKLF